MRLGTHTHRTCQGHTASIGGDPILSAPSSYVLPGSLKVGWDEGQCWTIFVPSLSDLLDDHFH